MTTPTDTAAVEAMIERLKGYANHDPQTSWRSQCERDAIAILAALAEERDAAEAEVAALREALREIEAVEIDWRLSTAENMRAASDIARAALKENHDGL